MRTPHFLVLMVELAFLLCVNCSCVDCNKEKKTNGTENASLPTVSVDDVFSNPAKYTTPIRMTGKVIRVDSASSTVYLGCGDACVQIPVRHQGTAPSAGASVMAVGRIIKVDGKYLFDAKQVQSQ